MSMALNSSVKWLITFQYNYQSLLYYKSNLVVFFYPMLLFKCILNLLNSDECSNLFLKINTISVSAQEDTKIAENPETNSLDDYINIDTDTYFISFINIQFSLMQAEINPTLQIIPFDDKYAVKAQILVDQGSQKLFLMKTFLMFVLQLRSAMEQEDIKTVKGFILQTCEQLLERGGIDHIGFVINKKYHTIRNPNYEGIKDLLNINMKIQDSTDFTDTIICLRNSIQLQSKKLQEAKISICFFSSNVKQNQLNPIKNKGYRSKINKFNYNENAIQKLKNTIKAHTDECYFYSIAYVKRFSIKNQQYGNKQVYNNYFSSDAVDFSLIYQLGWVCSQKKSSFNVCENNTSLRQKFKEVSALMTYEFHQFSVMVPVRDSKKITFQPLKPQILKDEDESDNEMKQQQIITDEEIEQYLKQNKKEMNEQQQDQGEQEVNNEDIYEPNMEVDENIRYIKMDLNNVDETKFVMSYFEYFNKNELDLKQIHDKGYHIFKKIDAKTVISYPQKKKVIKVLAYKYNPEYISKNVNYHDPNTIELIRCQSQYYKKQLYDIIRRAQYDLLMYKKRFIGTFKKTKLYQTYLEVNEELQNQLRLKLFKIEQIVKQMYQKIFKDEYVRNQKQKRNMFELYSSIKEVVNQTNEVFVSIYKKQIKNQDIGKLSTAINYDKIKSSLKRKLIKRVNSNPKLVDEVYDRIEQICSKQILDYVSLEAKFKIEKSQVGNCMYTHRNFATSLKARDCIALVFQIERPDSAIADPGRIRIRQVSTLVTGVAKFFEVHQYLVQQTYESTLQAYNLDKAQFQNQFTKEEVWGCPCCSPYQYYIPEKNEEQKYQILKDQIKNQQFFGIINRQYKQHWDYWNRVDSKQTFFGIMPLYICEQNWKVSKQLMKLCMGWTACGQPLGYTYSQIQTIPFMVLSSLIRTVQQTLYKISELKEEIDKQADIKKTYKIREQINLIKHKLHRHQNLLKHTEQTCKAIMRDMSSANLQQPLNKMVIEKYLKYQNPLCRTIDVINNNSSFIGQIYTVIKLGMFEKPAEQKFHQFFKRLVEQELRRETDSWSNEEIQQSFVNKLLNVKVEEMDKPVYVVLQSQYLDRFNFALGGQRVYRTEFQIQREALEMIIKQNNQFNDTQRMTIIEYKRLYVNRVIWMWYVRFRLYGQKDRRYIHKWKSLDILNSYKLFTMIIQNKKQRKNWKRREAIMKGQYTDPFDFLKAKQFLELEFVKMRNRKQAKNIVLLNAQKYGKASQVFAHTKDLREAAGAIINISLGSEVRYFFQQVMKEATFPQEKLKILLRGEHEGVQLFKYGWKMSKKRMNLVRKRYPYQCQKYQYMF